MADSYIAGKDAAYIKPKLVPDNELRPRDNSGGYDYRPYSATFGDGGLVTGSKNHLSASGGDDGDSLEAERATGRKGYEGGGIPGQAAQFANRKRNGED